MVVDFSAQLSLLYQPIRAVGVIMKHPIIIICYKNSSFSFFHSPSLSFSSLSLHWLNVISLTSKSLQVPLSELNETLHTSRAMKNNRHVFFYMCPQSRLRGETHC